MTTVPARLFGALLARLILTTLTPDRPGAHRVELRHPVWCHRPDWPLRGEHRSRVLHAEAWGEPDHEFTIGAYVFQLTAPYADTSPGIAVEITGGMDDGRRLYVLQLGQAAALARNLRRLVTAAERSGGAA